MDTNWKLMYRRTASNGQANCTYMKCNKLICTVHFVTTLFPALGPCPSETTIVWTEMAVYFSCNEIDGDNNKKL
jgi:hypothetical protein